MEKMISTLFILISIVSMQASAVGFSSGSQFASSPIRGFVTVYCNGGEVVTYPCYDTVLDPHNYDYFVGPDGVVADQVSLSNLRADGSRRERTEVYLHHEKRSEGAFNLWISSLFQRPLLAMGTNTVDYRLISRGKIVHQGVFTVTVTSGATRTCPTSHYNSGTPNDCQSQYTVCQRYFEQYNYCR